MNVVNITIEKLREASWNPNKMDEAMLARLKESIKRYDLVENLVVRPAGDGNYEVLSGNQRLRVLKEAHIAEIPCVQVNLNDEQARLMVQALNHIKGEDDLGRRAELMRKVLETISPEEVAELLPETSDSLRALASMGTETMSTYLCNWQKSQEAKLIHMQFQVNASQLEVVQRALEKVLPKVNKNQFDNPNIRGNALYLLAKGYLEKEG